MENGYNEINDGIHKTKTIPKIIWIWKTENYGAKMIVFSLGRPTLLGTSHAQQATVVSCNKGWMISQC